MYYKYQNIDRRVFAITSERLEINSTTSKVWIFNDDNDEKISHYTNQELWPANWNLISTLTEDELVAELL